MKPTLMIDKQEMIYKLFIPETENLVCNTCNKKLSYNDEVLVCKHYDKHLPFKKRYYCSLNCKYNSKQHKYDQEETVLASIVQYINKAYELIDDYPTQLKETKLNLFQAVNLDNERVIDNTVYSGKPSLLGAKIGNIKSIDIKTEKKELNWGNLKRKK